MRNGHMRNGAHLPLRATLQQNLLAFDFTGEGLVVVEHNFLQLVEFCYLFAQPFDILVLLLQLLLVLQLHPVRLQKTQQSAHAVRTANNRQQNADTSSSAVFLCVTAVVLAVVNSPRMRPSSPSFSCSFVSLAERINLISLKMDWLVTAAAGAACCVAAAAAARAPREFPVPSMSRVCSRRGKKKAFYGARIRFFLSLFF